MALADSWNVLPTIPCKGEDPSAPAEACFTEDQESFNRIFEEKSSALAEGEGCREEARIAVRCCFDPNNEEDCNFTQFKLPTGPSSGEGLLSAMDSQIEMLVGESNRLTRETFICSYFMKQCESACSKVQADYQKALQVSGPNLDLTSRLNQLPGLKEMCSGGLSRRRSCLERSAKSSQFKAKQTLACSQGIRGGDQPRILCYTTQDGLEQCQYSNAKRTTYADLADPQQAKAIDEPLHEFGIVQKRNGDGSFDSTAGNCSGTPVGDGSFAITAAHCLEGGLNSISVDSGGSLHTRNLTCPSTNHYSGMVHGDTVLCSLDSPVPMEETLFVMTFDPEIESGCVPHDYFLRCGPDAVTQERDVTMVSYPASQKTSSGASTPIYSRGVAAFDLNTAKFKSDLFGDFGSSGAGVISEIEGRRVLITNESAMHFASQQVNMPLIEWKHIERMRTELEPQKLLGAEPIFTGSP